MRNKKCVHKVNGRLIDKDNYLTRDKIYWRPIRIWKNTVIYFTKPINENEVKKLLMNYKGRSWNYKEAKPILDQIRIRFMICEYIKEKRKWKAIWWIFNTPYRDFDR